MENKWESMRDHISYSTGGIMSKVIKKDEVGDVTLFSMSKDTDISTHTSTKAGYVYIIEGSGVFNLEGEDIHMKPGVFIFMDANAKHSLSAAENLSFILILRNV
ncbi:cupin domain-containing protein [Candidatus Woesearchaeota archaeon]|jgi:quercetin dioxygenase-like cupin family protein|nr:cupin domain-containing protein [Candidatus Woesearchaeota archaeon]MBT3538178.1 cupin domain-containing protein [Candidatus Woesearchaeota archaeon]MBT4697463.1 cupin domain-containing protein [Candidatus Woesearchaeota archaeon]MBT4716629.1 cupin domain-containing protein [Candidatus Woesearchaeota archaeon]MBT7105847.1 cupin domain-containing protein [Candidatus Woesearchaeota archaeon]